MEPQRILDKAVEKANENGFNLTSSSKNWCVSIIFSHEFAKALFGEDLIYDCCGYQFPIWEHHLQQMVIEPDPLKYLEKFI